MNAVPSPQQIVPLLDSAATPHLPKSPASPKVPFPAKFPVLNDFRSSAQFSQRQPGNSSCHSWHFSVQYSRTHMVHMWELHMILSNRAWPLQGSNSPMAEAARSATMATVFIITAEGSVRLRVPQARDAFAKRL